MYCQLLQDSTLLSLGCETTFWQLAGEPAFRNIGLLVVAVIGIGFAIYRSLKLHQQTKTAIRQVETNEAGLNIDRFHKGAAMLGDKEIAVRQAGIFILSALMQHKPKEFLEQVRRILCSFINSSSIEYTSSFKKTSGYPDARHDCISAFHTLCLLNSMRYQAPETHMVDCRYIYLNRCRLSNRNLSEFKIMHSVVRACELESTNLSNATIFSVDFGESIFTNSDLKDAQFIEVDFEAATFKNVDCLGTTFKNCTNLTYAQLSQAKNVDPEFLAKLKAKDQAAAANATEENSPT